MDRVPTGWGVTGWKTRPLGSRLLEMRLDQWLWALRVYKTRPISAEAIKSGRVLREGQPVKPGHEVRIGETISARVEGSAQFWTRTLRVLGAPKGRVGAQLVALYAGELTPAGEREKATQRLPGQPGVRPRGTGRPTKRQRRDIDALDG